MATRLYLNAAQTRTTAPKIPSSWSTGWNKTNSDNTTFTALPLSQISTDSILSYSLAGTGVSGQFTAVARHVSPPLAAQTISGTLKGVVQCFQVATTDNFTLAIAVKVISPDGTDRGVLLAVSASDNTAATPPEMATTTTSRLFRDVSENASISLSSVSVQEGDRLVIETGFRQASTATSSGTIYYHGGTNRSDLAENETATAFGNAWVEFSQDLVFENTIFPLASGSTPVDAAASINTDNPTPVIKPAICKSGDLVLMVAQQRATGATLTVFDAAGQTWNAETAIGNTNITAQLFWCVFNGTWTSNPAVSFGGTTCNSVVMHVIRPPNPSDIWAVNQAQVELDLAATTTQTITGQTTTGTEPTITIAGWFTADDNTWGTTTGTGWETLGVEQYRNTSGTDQSMAFAYKVQTAAGATGNVSKTQLTLGADAGTSFIITFSATNTNKLIPVNERSLTFTGYAPFLKLPSAQVTQVVAEVLTAPPSTARVTQTVAEVLTAPPSTAQVTQVVTEVLVENNRPWPAQATFTGQAPTLAFVVPVVETPAAGAITIAGQAPTLKQDTFVQPASRAVSIAGQVPVATQNYNEAPTVGTVSITGQAPTILSSRIFDVSEGSINVAGQAPTLKQDVYAQPANRSVLFAGQVPITSQGASAFPTVDTLNVTGQAPTILSARIFDVPVGAVTLAGQIPVLKQDVYVQPSVRAALLSGQAPSLLQNAILLPGTQGLTITGQAPSLFTQYVATPSAYALSATGAAPSLITGLALLPTAGALTLLGQAPIIRATEAILEGFRWRNDNGTEVTATWRQLQDTGDTALEDEIVRLRVVIDSRDDLPARDFELQYRKVGDTVWNKVK